MFYTLSQLPSHSMILPDCTITLSTIGFWHDTVVCPSICLSVMKCIVVLRVGVGGWKLYHGPCGARGCCRISPPRFLAECRKRWLNGGSFVSAVCLVVFFDLYCVYLCIFVIYIEFFPYCLFVSNSQVTGCKDHLRNDLYTVGWGVKLDSIQSKLYHHVPRVALP